MPEIEGTSIDPNEVAAVEAALHALADQKAGMWRHMITDQFIHDVAEEAVIAGAQYRAAPKI